MDILDKQELNAATKATEHAIFLNSPDVTRVSKAYKQEMSRRDKQEQWIGLIWDSVLQGRTMETIQSLIKRQEELAGIRKTGLSDLQGYERNAVIAEFVAIQKLLENQGGGPQGEDIKGVNLDVLKRALDGQSINLEDGRWEEICADLGKRFLGS